METASEQFNAHYNKELDRIERLNKNTKEKRKFNTWSALRVIWACYGRELLRLSFVRLIYEILEFAAPKLLSLLINFIKYDQPIWQGYYIIFALILSNFIKIISINYYLESCLDLGIRIESALNVLIFSKTLKLAPKAKKAQTTGGITNLIAVDTARFWSVVSYLADIWSAPFTICFSIYMLWQQLSEALFAGVLIIVLVLVCNSVIMHFLEKYNREEMKIKDERVKLCTEVLAGMKIIKLYGW